MADEPARRGAGARATLSGARISLDFAGAPLSLPPPDGASAEDAAPAVSSEAPLANVPHESGVLSTTEGPVADAWARLRDSHGGRARPRSPTPPAMDALELVARRSRPSSVTGIDFRTEMRDRFALGDYSSALRAAELLLGRVPDDPDALHYASRSRERLIALHSARVGILGGVELPEVGALVPRVVVDERDVRWLGLDARQGFLLSRVDGRQTVDELVDGSGLSRLDALRTIVELLEVKAIAVR